MAYKEPDLFSLERRILQGITTAVSNIFRTVTRGKELVLLSVEPNRYKKSFYKGNTRGLEERH